MSTRAEFFQRMYPGLSAGEVIDELIKASIYGFEHGPEVVTISAAEGIHYVSYDAEMQKKAPYWEGTYETCNIPFTDFQIRYQPEQVRIVDGKRILEDTAFLCRKDNDHFLILPSINEQEAEIVRLIFDKYVYEGYGAQRIATYLNNAGYRARSGKCWHPGSLRGMVGNLTYMGVLRCGDARSELMPELQIIPQEEFEAAQRIREDRSAHAAEEAEHHVPLRTRGQALLSNNVYCGHCGARLALTTSRKWRKLSDGTLDDTLRIRYTCYGKLRKQTDCTGQTGYTMHILDEIIDKMVRQIFSRLRGIPKEQLITSRYAKETAERKNHLQALQAERDKAEKDLLALKTEILAVIKGESAFPKDTLAEMIAAQEKKHTELETLCEEASAELERNAELMANVSQLYEELISYADLYDSASFEAKKMIVSQLIRRVEVYRGYQIHVDFNFDPAQYLENSDELAC